VQGARFGAASACQASSATWRYRIEVAVCAFIMVPNPYFGAYWREMRVKHGLPEKRMRNYNATGRPDKSDGPPTRISRQLARSGAAGTCRAASVAEYLLPSPDRGSCFHGSVKPALRSALARNAGREVQFTQTLALRNRRIQPPSSRQSAGAQEHCRARNTRSGWGIMIVARPSALVSPVMPAGEPLGLAG